MQLIVSATSPYGAKRSNPRFDRNLCRDNAQRALPRGCATLLGHKLSRSCWPIYNSAEAFLGAVRQKFLGLRRLHQATYTRHNVTNDHKASGLGADQLQQGHAILDTVHECFRIT